MKKVLKYSPKIYKSIENIVINKGKGIYLFDKYNNKYIDCIAGYSSLNQGHCHPLLINTIVNQSKKLTLTSRVINNNIMGNYCEYICKTFNYEQVLLTNTGVEACESAIKIARAWGYKYKKVPLNQAINVFFSSNFWGRSLAACSSSDDPLCYENYGPYMPNFKIIEYNNIKKLDYFLMNNPNTVSVMLEPIQGEGGINIPDKNYLYKVKNLCLKYNVLMICDEIQTGLGRTGKMLAIDHYNIIPDIICLGKALSGGMYPISAVLSSKEIMSSLELGSHGSTYGGNPLAAKIGITALQIIINERLSQNAKKMGSIFRKRLNKNYHFITEIRGVGLLNAIEFKSKKYADIFVKELIIEKVLTKTTRDKIVRITPPLVISKKEVITLINKIEKVLERIN
jgi:ornithine--oxo-acid transaminase